jgi:hypothetical protein
MRARIAEVHKHTVTEKFREVAIETGYDGGAGFLIKPHDVPEVFGIEAFGHSSGADEVTEHHGEMTALGLCRLRGSSRWRYISDRNIIFGNRRDGA